MPRLEMVPSDRYSASSRGTCCRFMSKQTAREMIVGDGYENGLCQAESKTNGRLDDGDSREQESNLLRYIISTCGTTVCLVLIPSMYKLTKTSIMDCSPSLKSPDRVLPPLLRRDRRKYVSAYSNPTRIPRCCKE